MAFIQKNLANFVTSLGIISGIFACIFAVVFQDWQISTGLLIFWLLTDGLDGRVARKFWSTKVGPYLDDIADFIHFGIHPAIWIWVITGHIVLATLYAVSIVYRLVRFTMKKQNTSTLFSGLPSPAAAIGIFGIIFSPMEREFVMIGVLFITCLAVSSLPCFHVMKNKNISRLMPLIVFIILVLPWIFGGGKYWIAITELVCVSIYILFSFISMIPHYVNR